MNYIIKPIYIFTIIISLFIISNAQTDWIGEYFFEEDAGTTADGTKLYAAHNIKIAEKSGNLEAHIHSQGFQTYRDVYADVKIVGDEIKFYFREEGLHHYTSKYEKGDLLLSFKKKISDKKPEILTSWNEFEPLLVANQESGKIYFEKTVNKQNTKSDTRPTNNKEWLRFETEDKEFSIAMPSNTLISAKKTFLARYILQGYENGVTIQLVIHSKTFAKARKNAVKGRKKRLTKSPQKRDRNNGTTKETGTFTVNTTKYYSPSSGFTSNMLISSGKKSYSLFVNSPTLKNEAFDRLLMSLKLDGQKFYQDAQVTNYIEKIVSLEKLKSSPEVIEAFKRKPANIKRKVTYQIGNLEYKLPVEKQRIYSRKAFIVEEPSSKYASSIAKLGYSKVILELELLANGQVGDVVAITDGDEEFAQKCCVSVIDKLKFVPAQINGINVSSTEVIEYSILTLPGITVTD